jgi:predicted nucleotidyltransferase
MRSRASARSSSSLPWGTGAFYDVYTCAHRAWHNVCMVTNSEIDALSERIVREFSPERVILFGSYAYGTPSDESDVDLMVLLPFEGKGLTKSLEIWNRVRPPFSVDILARRPDDTARRYREWDPLVREALDRGRVLYERNGS